MKFKELFGKKEGGNVETCLTQKMKEANDLWWNIFKGESPWARKKEAAHQLRFTSIITKYLARLVVSEIKYECQDEWLNTQIQKNLMPKIDEMTQYMLVGGYVVIKPYLTANRQSVYFDFGTSLNFEPIAVDENGQIIDGVFNDETVYKGKIYVRKEHHTFTGNSHIVENKAYIKGSRFEVELNTIPRWQSFLTYGEIKTRIPLIATLRTPYANNIDCTSDLPISFYANSISTLENIDIAYTDYVEEMRKIRAKIFADSSIMNGGKIMDDYFVDFSGDPTNKLADQIYAYAPAPRETQYLSQLKTIISIFEVETGISSGTFTFNERTGAVTATQVISEDKTTYHTVNQIQQQLKAVLQSIYEIAVIICSAYKIDISNANVEPVIEFGDSVFEDTGTEFNRRLQLVQSGMLRPEKFIMWYFGVPEEKAKEMMPDMSQLFDEKNGGDE